MKSGMYLNTADNTTRCVWAVYCHFKSTDTRVPKPVRPRNNVQLTVYTCSMTSIVNCLGIQFKRCQSGRWARTCQNV